MYSVTRHKNLIKHIILIILFVISALTITKNIAHIYTTSTGKQGIRVPIIMYHQVKNNSFGKDVISPYEFESDLKYLYENNYHTIVMADLIDYVYHDKDLPDNPIILSFDDGYLSTYQYVFPLLKKYQMKIVLSIVGKTTDDFSRVNDNNVNYAHIPWRKLDEMVESGLVEIQNHSYNLHKVKNGRYGCGQKYNESLEDYEKIIENDVNTFQIQMEVNIHDTSNTFTYPYGKYNDNTENILKNLGFKATLTCTYGVNVVHRNPEELYGLKRMCRAHNHNISKLIKEGMETLKYLKE